MPAILTLHSGAALARSSNLISASSSDTTDGMGRTLCVDKSSVVYADADGSSEIFDLGEPPSADLNIIRGPAEVQYFEGESSSTPISPGAMCRPFTVVAAANAASVPAWPPPMTSTS